MCFAVLAFGAAAADRGEFERAQCPIEVPEGLVEGRDVICGYVATPVHHAQLDGPTLRLAVVRFPGISSGAAADPLVLLSGGPGESNLRAFVPGMASPAGVRLRAKRDVLVIELRGLFYSRPNLVCPERFDLLQAQLAEDPGSARAVASDVDAIRACHARLVAQGIDLAAFNNAESAADIAVVVKALGYEEFDLYANSAGTILAQRIMRTAAQSLRSVTLGSVLPLDEPTWPAMPANGIRAVKRVFESCAANEFCRRAYPTLETDFLSLIDRLDRRPVSVALIHPQSGKTVTLLLTGQRVAQWVYGLLLTDANAAASIPFVISRLVAQDYRPLQLAVGLFMPERSFSQGLQYSVACAEMGRFDLTPRDPADPYAAFAGAISALSFGPERLLDACRIWDVPALPQLKTDGPVGIPTLLLAGDVDPATPPSYARTVARSLADAYVYVLPGIAHSPIDGGACPLSIAAAFLDEPARKPDADCISHMAVVFVSAPIAERLLSPSVPHLILLLACVCVILAAPVVGGFNVWRRKRGPLTLREPRFARGCVTIAIGLDLVFLSIVAVSDPARLIYGYPALVRWATLLPLLSVVPSTAALACAFAQWRASDGGGAHRVGYAILALASLILVEEIVYWRLLTTFS